AAATLVVVAAFAVVLAQPLSRERAPARAGLRAKRLARAQVAVCPAVTVGGATRDRGAGIQGNEQVHAHRGAAVHARYARSGKSERTALPDAHRIVGAVGTYRTEVEGVDARVRDPKIPGPLGEIRIAREPLLAVG